MSNLRQIALVMLCAGILTAIASVGCDSTSTSTGSHLDHVPTRSPTQTRPTTVKPTSTPVAEISAAKTANTASDSYCTSRSSQVCGYIRAGNYSVVGQDGVYLGQLVPSRTSNSRYASICDASRRKTISRGTGSPYGSLIGDLSAQALLADKPPLIVDGRGNAVMYVTKRALTPEGKRLPKIKPDDLLRALDCR